MSYEYKMVQIPATIVGDRKRPQAAAEYIEGIANEKAADGWEFYRLDSMNVHLPGGCLAGTAETRAHHVITFRREQGP